MAKAEKLTVAQKDAMVANDTAATPFIDNLDPAADVAQHLGRNGIRLCQKDKLCVLGTAGSMPNAPFEDDGYEIWTIGQATTYPQCKRYDLLFEMHSKGYWEKHPPVKERLSKATVPMYMHQVYKEIPQSVKYPIDIILEKYRTYFVTSIGYMLALALYSWETVRKPAHIAIFGIHMENREEYTEQRPNVEYWLGRLEGAGVDLLIAPGGAIFQSKILYGYEAYSPYCLDLKERIHGLVLGREEWAKRRDHCEAHRWKHIGAIEEDERLLRQLQTGAVNIDNTPLEPIMPGVDVMSADPQFAISTQDEEQPLPE